MESPRGTILVNGRPRPLRPGLAVAVQDLLVELGLERGRVAVEVNGQIVPREERTRRHLREGDVVEVVTFVGGG